MQRVPVCVCMREQAQASERKPELPAEKPLFDLAILQLYTKQHIFTWSSYSVILVRLDSITPQPSLKSGYNLLSALKIRAKGQTALGLEHLSAVWVSWLNSLLHNGLPA